MEKAMGKQVWQSDDGKIFNELSELITYEHKEADKLVNKLDKVRESLIRHNYSRKPMPKDSDQGIWHIRGEDPNCDMHGPHVQPSLCYFKGNYKQAIEHAATLPAFFAWGTGGDIDLIKVVYASIEGITASARFPNFQVVE